MAEEGDRAAALEKRIADLEERIASIEGTRNEIRAERFVVVDEDDNILAVLAKSQMIKEGGGGGGWYGPPEQVAGELLLYNETGEPSVVLTARNGPGELKLFPRNIWGAILETLSLGWTDGTPILYGQAIGGGFSISAGISRLRRALSAQPSRLHVAGLARENHGNSRSI